MAIRMIWRNKFPICTCGSAELKLKENSENCIFIKEKKNRKENEEKTYYFYFTLHPSNKSNFPFSSLGRSSIADFCLFGWIVMCIYMRVRMRARLLKKDIIYWENHSAAIRHTAQRWIYSNRSTRIGIETKRASRPRHIWAARSDNSEVAIDRIILLFYSSDCHTNAFNPFQILHQLSPQAFQSNGSLCPASSNSGPPTRQPVYWSLWYVASTAASTLIF